MTTSEAEYLAIGEVLSLLKETFPDVTISKIRFLESQGLINPERTPSGYRKFSLSDIEILHWVLTMQRDHFLPLKVIKAKLLASGGVPLHEAPPVARPNVETGGQPSLFESSTVGASETTISSQRGSAETADGVTVAVVMIEDVMIEDVMIEDVSIEEIVIDVIDLDPSNPVTTDPVTTDPVTTSVTSTALAETDAASETSVAAGDTDPGAWLAALQESPLGDVLPEQRRPRAVPDRPAEMIADIVPQFDDSRFTAAELADAAEVSLELVEQLATFGLLAASILGGETTYNSAALDVVQSAKGFLDRGIEPRHLRGFKLAAEREATLFEQLLIPLLRQRNPQARADAMAELGRLTAMGEALRRSLLHQALHSHLSPR